MTRRAPILILMLAQLIWAGGCSDEGDLTGSLTDVYRLDHDFVRARMYGSELSIEYGLDNGSVPIRVTLRVDEVDLGADQQFDLGETGAITGQLSDGTNLPAMLGGDLSLDEFEQVDGSDISGSFDATFDGSRDTLSLAGKFDTTLDIIDWPRYPDGGMDEEQR